MNHKVLVTTQMMLSDQNRFANLLQKNKCQAEFIPSKQFLPESECLKLNAVYDGWIAGDDEITPAVIDHLLPKLRVISKWGTGIDSISKDYAHSKGIEVKNTPGAFGVSVSEVAVGYLISLIREISTIDRMVRDGNWPKKQTRNLSNLKVAIIGFGPIGHNVGTRLLAFGCEIFYVDPIVRDENQSFIKADLLEVVESCDAFVIACNLNDSTFHMFNDQLFSKIKRGAYLVNVSRGPIICENALIRALEKGIIAGVALDVYEVEPINLNNKLFNFSNVILGSHNSNNSIEAVEYVHKNTIDNLLYVLNKGD